MHARMSQAQCTCNGPKFQENPTIFQIAARCRGDVKLVGGANGANKGLFTTRKYAS
jgi:hypothetical protein